MFLSIHAPWTDRERTKTQAERASEDIVQPKGVLADADAQWRVFAGLLKEHFGDGGGVVRHLHQVRESLEKKNRHVAQEHEGIKLVYHDIRVGRKTCCRTEDVVR